MSKMTADSGLLDFDLLPGAGTKRAGGRRAQSVFVSGSGSGAGSRPGGGETAGGSFLRPASRSDCTVSQFVRTNMARVVSKAAESEATFTPFTPAPISGDPRDSSEGAGESMQGKGMSSSSGGSEEGRQRGSSGSIFRSGKEGKGLGVGVGAEGASGVTRRGSAAAQRQGRGGVVWRGIEEDPPAEEAAVEAALPVAEAVPDCQNDEIGLKCYGSEALRCLPSTQSIRCTDNLLCLTLSQTAYRRVWKLFSEMS